ncbi:MAG: type II secretion system F family protein [bacterium]
MIFTYTAVTENGEKKDGSIEAVNKELAIAGLQRRGLIVTSLKNEKESQKWYEVSFFEKVSLKEVVILSRQMSTLFEAQVSALKAFSLMAGNTENPVLKKKLDTIVTDLQSGSSISGALAKHGDVFSDFYVNMVKAGEESGKLTQVFSFLADYLDRQYALTSKTKHALVYPGFVIGVFGLVMVLMLTFVVPKLSAIIIDSGQQVPFYTKVIFAISDFFVHYWWLLLVGIAIFLVTFIQFFKTKKGQQELDILKLKAPFFGPMFRKLYLARIADNMDTMLSSGIPIIRAIDITAAIVGNDTYKGILLGAMEQVKGGKPLSASLEGHDEIPKLMPQIIRIGEETGSLGSILKMLAHFYQREVEEAVDTLIGLIEPFMIIMLGLGVGILLVSVLMPIYNIAGGIN